VWRVGHQRLGLGRERRPGHDLVGGDRLVLGGRRPRRGARGDRRPLPRGRLERPQRAGRLGHRPQRHPLQLRLVDDHRRGGAADHQADCAGRGHRRRRQGGRGVLWHCDRDGNYSLYSQAAASENYLRGAQEADAGGTVSFKSIFPACYSGRWPHIHFEVYGSLSDATSSGPIVKTSQIALPKEACEAVYATSGYEQSVSNLSQVSLTSDNVFSDDGAIHQLATMSGDASGGYVAALTIGV
jgi:hypothetical protein